MVGAAVPVVLVTAAVVVQGFTLPQEGAGDLTSAMVSAVLCFIRVWL